MARTAPFLLALLAALCMAGEDPATYVNGTVSTIPSSASGKLDLSDAEALNFRYGDDTFSVSYDRIVSVRLGQENKSLGSKVSGSAAAVGRTVMPMFFSPKTKQLTIEFEDEDARPQSLVLELSAYEANAALPVLEARRANPEEAKGPQGPLYGDSTWWGNRMWRTKRNKHMWPDRPEEKDGSQADSKVDVAAGKE